MQENATAEDMAAAPAQVAAVAQQHALELGMAAANSRLQTATAQALRTRFALRNGYDLLGIVEE